MGLNIAPFAEAESWPEFRQPSDNQCIDDTMNDLADHGVNPDDLVRLGNEGVKERRRWSGCGRPFSRGVGPGHRLPPGRYRYANGTWTKIG